MKAAMATLVVALMALRTQVATAQPPGSSGSAGVQFFDPLVGDLESYVGENDAQLIIMGSAADAPPPGPPPGAPQGAPPGARVRVCGGQPALMTRSAGEGNGACFGPNVSTTLSCSCIDGLDRLTSWRIRVKPVEPKSAGPQPTTIPASTVLGINSLLVFTLPRTLVSFSLIAETEEPLQLQFMSLPGPPTTTSAPALVRVPSTNVLDTLEIANIALGSVKIEENKFIPANVRNVTLRNCNLARVRTSFLDYFINLQSLDVSFNQLAGVLQDLTPTYCSASACPLQYLNLSGNAITQLPTALASLSQLQELDLSNNPIKNLSTDNATADAFAKLKVFKLSAPADGVTCDGDILRQIQSAQLCVPAATGDMSKTTTPEPASSSKTVLILAPIGGLIVVVLVVFIAMRLRSRGKNVDDKNAQESLFDSTAPYDNSHGTVDPSLVNDPIIITHRIPYKEIRLANCISKGGFGLVYSGVYNRRRVAIKKIRPDRAGDIKQIESFLKEICLMATLNHPRIVEFVGVSWDSLRNLCAVTEFMERGDLREVLHGFKLRNTPLTWESNKTAIALHIAEGLTYLHSLSPKVIHRDLKSKNVLLNGEMTAKLSDFGISREFDIDVTHMTAGIGTSFWIAPEVLLGKDYDERADIFSFGVVLSEIDTDDYPYWNASNAEAGGRVEQNVILQLVATGSLRPTFSDSCPQQILELADMCLQVDPHDRPTAAEVAYELQRMIAMLPPRSQGGFSRNSSSFY